MVKAFLQHTICKVKVFPPLRDSGREWMLMWKKIPYWIHLDEDGIQSGGLLTINFFKIRFFCLESPAGPHGSALLSPGSIGSNLP